MNAIVFDTETIGKKTQTLLNVGYKIIDINPATSDYTVLCERSYLDRSLYANRLFMLNDDFVGEEKLAVYDALVNEDKIVLRSMKQIFTTMTNDLARHNVKFGFAYNCDFDIDKFAKTAVTENIDNPLADIEIFDIWGYASNLICQTEEYKNWAIENAQFTATKKFISTSVEAVTRYLARNLDFVEEHTALSDVHWEIEILAECVRRGADITKPMKRNSYIKSGYIFTETIEDKRTGEVFTFDYTDKKTDKETGAVTIW